MADVNSLTDMISALRAEIEQDSITPERLGYLLQCIVDTLPSLIPKTSIVKDLVVLADTGDLPETPSSNTTGYLIDGHLYVYVGTGGDTADGKYQDCGAFQGVPGEPGIGFSSVSTPSPTDGTVIITLSNGDKIIIDLNHNHPGYAVKKNVTSTTDSSITLSSDTIYDLGTVSSNKTINLPTTVDVGAEYEFRLAYTSGNITLPSGVSVANDATLTFTQGKTYQVIISGGILYFSETTTPS